MKTFFQPLFIIITTHKENGKSIKFSWFATNLVESQKPLNKIEIQGLKKSFKNLLEDSYDGQEETSSRLEI